MALLLPQCALPESLHQLATSRHRLSVHWSRKSARATHGTTESSSGTKASTDHFKIPGTEPCCNLISPLVMTPRKPVRRSSRLRVRKGNREDAKTDTPTDMDAAEWISRVLANNGVVEVDPVTMAEQMHHAKHYEMDPSNNTHYHSANYSSSSEASDIYPPRGPGFSSRVPLGVALAAGSAVALATVALLIQALHRQADGTISNSSDSEGNNLASSFKGEPVAPDHSSKGSRAPQHRTRDNEVLASMAAAGAATFQPGNFTGRNNMPLPPSLQRAGSKGEKPQSQNKYASVTPFFASDRSPVSYSRPPPPPVSRWGEDKYKSIRPFFPDDRVAAAIESVPPFFPDEQGSKKTSENGSSSNKTVTPFFADEQQGSKNAKGSTFLETVTPFFADEQQSRNGPSLEAVTPFFADEQGSEQRKNGSSLENVTPFFADEQQPGRSSTGVPRSKGKIDVENVKPFFPDDQVGSSSGSSSSQQSSSGSRPSQVWDGDSSSGAQRDSLAEAMVDLTGRAPVKSSESTDQRRTGVSTPTPEDLLSVSMQSEGKQVLAEMAGKSQGQHKEFMEGSAAERLASNLSGAFSFQGDGAPDVARPLTPEELALLEEMKTEEERRFAKMQALQAAFPALAIGAGAVGALVGVDGAFEMVGITATASFISYELLWANKRQELLDEISRITDHHKLFSFLQKRKIVKDDC